MLGTGVGTAIDGGAQGRSGEACRWSRRTQRKFHGAAARRPLPWSPPCTLSLCKEKWRQVLALFLPFPSRQRKSSSQRQSPYQYALALRFVRDARDGATANVTVAIATASDLGPLRTSQSSVSPTSCSSHCGRGTTSGTCSSSSLKISAPRVEAGLQYPLLNCIQCSVQLRQLSEIKR